MRKIKIAADSSVNVLQLLPKVDVQIHECRGLCSYYAEKGGMLVGFEKCYISLYM